MEKCVGNCAICTLNVDKMACCLVQNLRLNIEIKGMLKQLTAQKPDAFATLASVIPSEEVSETGPLASGTAGVDLLEDE